MADRENAVVILERVLAGEMSGDDVVVEWPAFDEPSNEIVMGAMGELTHVAPYIGKKTSEYAETQRGQRTSNVPPLNNETRDA